MLQDAHARRIDYLRISLTDRCNLRCSYCMPAEGVPHLPHGEILRFEEIAAFVRVAARRGVTSARLTGGEPLARRGVVELVRALRAVPHLDEVALTTNGTLLAPLAAELRAAGLGRVNVGLVSLEPDVYRAVTRGGDLRAALDGIAAALAAGLHPVKVNVVLLRGVNDDPAPFLDLTRRLPIEVRFIEYMPIGDVPGERLLPMAEFAARLAALGPFEQVETLPGRGPASRGLRVPGAPGRIASITGVSDHFCAECNRLRLTADGHLRPCLFSGAEVDLRPALRPTVDEVELEALLARAIAAKPACMPPGGRVVDRRMSQIGG